MLNHSLNQYQPVSDTQNNPPTTADDPPNSPQPPPVFGQESTPSGSDQVTVVDQSTSQQQLNQAVGQLITPQPEKKDNQVKPPYPSSNQPSTTPVVAKTITAAPATASISSIPDKIAQEIRETPLIETKALSNQAATVSWKKAAIISISLFFVGALVGTFMMMMLY